MDPTVRRRCSAMRLSRHLGCCFSSQFQTCEVWAPPFLHMREVSWCHCCLQDTKPWFIVAAPSCWPPTQLSSWPKELDSFLAMCISHSPSFLHPPRVMDDIHIHTRSQRLNPILSKPGQDFCRKWKLVVKIPITSQCNMMTWNWHDSWCVSSLPTPGYCACGIGFGEAIPESWLWHHPFFCRISEGDIIGISLVVGHHWASCLWFIAITVLHFVCISPIKLFC